MCAVDDCEPWKVSRTEYRKSRKEHSCTECARTIQRGEKYQYITGTTGDQPSWEQFRTCQHCEAAGAWLMAACDGWPLTMLLEELQEHRDEYPSSTVLGDLCVAVISKWGGGSAPLPDAAALRADAERYSGD